MNLQALLSRRSAGTIIRITLLCASLSVSTSSDLPAADAPPQDPAQAKKAEQRLQLPTVTKASAAAITVDNEERVALTLEVDGAEEEVIKRSLDVSPAQMDAWQREYLDELKKTKAVLWDDERQRIVREKGNAAQMPAAIAAEAKPLVTYQGLPKLPPEVEQELIDRCLMIRSTDIVNNKRASDFGAWSFGHLMTELANEDATGIKPADLTERWLAHWQNDQVINGFRVPNRKRGIEQLVLNHWPRKMDGELDLEKSPFRLLAIILRLDLRSNEVLGSQRIDDGGAGEARLVYCAVDKEGAPLAFTVIFEYGVKRSNFQGVLDWAREWYKLRELDPKSADYQKHLETLTRSFTDRDTDIESPPNRSSLNALRTNEIDLVLRVPPQAPAEVVWEVREFRLDTGNEGHLRQVTVKQTPDLTFDASDKLATLINTPRFESDILKKRHATPTDFPAGVDFLGGSSITPENIFWKSASIKNLEARHLFSFGTCSGCHAREAFPLVGPPDGPAFDDVRGDVRQPPHFTHVRPRKQADVAELSAFLTGKDPKGKPFVLADPAGQKDPKTGKVIERPFGDLSVRAHDFFGLVKFGAYYEIHRQQRSQVH